MGLRSRLETQPTDFQQSTSYFGDRTLKGRIVKDGVRKAVQDRQIALDILLKAIREFRKFTDQPLTLRGGDYAHAVQELNKAIDPSGRAFAVMPILDTKS